MEINESLKLIFVTFLTFLLSALIRIAVLRLPVPFPQNFLILVMGMVFGYVDKYYPQLGFGELLEVKPLSAMDIVNPVLLFEAAIFTNLEAFMISGVQLTLLVFLVFGLSMAVLGFIVTYIFTYGWSWNHAIILCAVSVVPAPILNRSFIKRMTAPQKLQYFIEGEAVVGNCLAFIVFKFSVVFLVYESPGIVALLGQLFLSPVLGFLIAKGVVYWMSKIIGDPVNQVCIVIASLYICYLLAEVAHLSGLIAVVVMGLLMTGKRSNMSEKTEKILVRFLHAMSSFMNNNLVMLCGLQTIHFAIPVATWIDILNIFIIFCAVNAVRGLVVFLLYPMLKHTGYCLSKNNTVVVALCNLRGAITILMATCLLHPDFNMPAGQKIYVLTLGQIILSLLVNSTVTNIVIRYDVMIGLFCFILKIFTDDREAKACVFSNGLNVVNEIRLHTMSYYKHQSIAIADADWSVVEMFTQLQHPLFNITRRKSQTNGKAEEDKDIIERRAISRILTMMKCSYWKQYEDGHISRDAVKQLYHWSNEALAKGSTLIFPTKIESVLTVPEVHKLAMEALERKLNSWKQLSRKGKWLSLHLAVVIITIHLVDLTMTTVQLVQHILISSDTHWDVYFWYNLIFVLCHALLLLNRYWRKLPFTVWEVHLIFVVIVGVLDLFAIYILTSKQSYSQFLRVTLICTRYLRVLRMAEVSPWFLSILLTRLLHNTSRRLFEGFDIGSSYIRGRLEVFRLLNYVGREIPDDVLKRFKNLCKRHKIETSRMLGYLHIQHPAISTSAKTRQATRIIFKKQLQTLKKMKSARTLAYEDGAQLDKMISTKLVKLTSSNIIVPPCSIDRIIANVPWIEKNYEVYSLFVNKGLTKHYEESDVIVPGLSRPHGIHIIISGLVLLKRYSETEDNEIKDADYLTSGDVIGEYTFLTGKTRRKYVIAETDVKTIFIDEKYLWKYTAGFPQLKKEVLSELEVNMWRVVALRIAYRFLLSEASWFGLSQTEILEKIVEGKLLDGKADTASFSHHVMTSDIILINGNLIDLASSNLITGPAFIPKGHTHFAYKNVNNIRPVLFALPVKAEDDENQDFRIYRTRWDLGTVTEKASGCTLSSDSSNMRPFQKKKETYRNNKKISFTGEGHLETEV